MRIEFKNCKMIETIEFSEQAKTLGLIIDDGFNQYQVSISKEMFGKLAGREQKALTFVCSLKGDRREYNGRVFWNNTLFVLEIRDEEIVAKWVSANPVNFNK